MTANYWAGFVVGFLLASFFGFIFNQIRIARLNMGKHKKPMAIVVPGSLTPVQVIRNHRLAYLKVAGWIILASIGAGLVLFLSSQL